MGIYFLKKVVAAAAVKQARLHTALFESSRQSRTGTSRFSPAFR
jgi:hypothetical protein